ncbi:hypothetical protein BDN72DRAFT_779501, partial [Pluteus cervinus]
DEKSMRSGVTIPYRTNGKITDSFERKGEKETYSHIQFDKTQTKFEIAIWVCQDNRPFSIIGDRGFLRLMKTGRPGYYVPSASTVSCDVKRIFTRTRTRIAKILQECSRVSFQVDAWMLPNHKAYVGIVVTFEYGGEVKKLVLDIVKVAEVCSPLFSHKIVLTTHLVPHRGELGQCLLASCQGVWIGEEGLEHYT